MGIALTYLDLWTLGAGEVYYFWDRLGYDPYFPFTKVVI